MSLQAKRWILITPILLLTAYYISGCIKVAEKAVQSLSTPVVEDKQAERRIEVVQKMRTQAVSRRVGRWAVVVGISDYRYDTHWNKQKGIPDLKYAHRDAKAFAKFLISPQGGAFTSDHVLVLTNRKATIKEVRNAIGNFLARSLEDDLVIIFFTGHGAPDPKNPKDLYLLCYDSEPDNYYGTALPMYEINIALSRKIRSKKVFVIADACHSAGISGSKGVSVSARFNQYMEKLAGAREGVTKIAASREDELSMEREFPEGGHGVFTYYLLKGLRGEADKDRDGFVTMKEAFDYLYDRVRSDTRHSQNPWVSAYVSGDIPLGIVDRQVLDAISARVESSRKEPSLPQKRIWQPPPSPTIDIPKDSAVAVKLARAKLAKGDIYQAKQITERILARNDAGKPDALVLKIELLLMEGDLKGAEDVEDHLVIPYPKHPAAIKGARLVYQHYLRQIGNADPGQQIRQLELYLKRHPGGLLENEAGDKISKIRAEVRSSYKKRFKESLVMAEGYINRNQFKRARKELDSAGGIEREAFSTYRIRLDTNRIANLRLQADKQEQQYKNRMFHKHFDEAKSRFIAGDYTGAYGELELAKSYATSAQMKQAADLASRYNAPPEVDIVVESSTVYWEAPVKFQYRATDQEGDLVRVVSWDFGDGKTSKADNPEHVYDKWSGPEKERRYMVTIQATDGRTTVAAKMKITVKRQDRIRTFVVNGVSFKMIRIPVGKFTIGSPPGETGRYDDERQHQVALTKSFWMGQTEVTQSQWKAVMGNNPSDFRNCGDACPVENVSWNDVQEFIRRLNQKEGGNKYRLPTEAEWEYACRAGSTSRFYFGDDEGRLKDYAWYVNNSGQETHPVAQKKPNTWGLYDIQGNVWEWCKDWYGKYPSGSVTDPTGPDGGSGRVLRGGSWYTAPRSVRCALRNRYRPGSRDNDIGFRLVRTD